MNEPKMTPFGTWKVGTRQARLKDVRNRMAMMSMPAGMSRIIHM